MCKLIEQKMKDNNIAMGSRYKREIRNSFLGEITVGCSHCSCFSILLENVKLQSLPQNFDSNPSIFVSKAPMFDSAHQFLFLGPQFFFCDSIALHIDKI